MSPIGKQRANTTAVIAYSPGAKRYLAAWTSGTPDGFFYYAGSDVRGVEIERSGTVRAPGSIPLAATADGEWTSAVLPLAGSKMLLAYGRNDTNPPYGLRARARIIDLDGIADAGAPMPGDDAGSAGTSSGSAPEAGVPSDDGGIAASPSGGESSCGCSVVGLANRQVGGVVFLLGALAAVLRRRRCREAQE